jgi:hypothetical protein
MKLEQQYAKILRTKKMFRPDWRTFRFWAQLHWWVYGELR